MLDGTFYQQLDAFYAAGDAEGAEIYLRAALDETWLDEHNHADRATVYNELMGHYRTSGDFEECELAMKGLLREIRALRLKSGLEYATLMLNVANAQRVLGMLVEAERNFLIVRDEFEAMFEPDDYRLASLYNNIGLTYRAMGQTDIARSYFERALDIVHRIPEARTAVAATCSNLADMLAGEGDLDTASVFAQEAVGVYAEPEMPLGIDYSAALSAAAHIEYLRGDFGAAVELYNRAADSLERAFGKTRAYITICRNLVEAYHAAGMHGDAARIENEIQRLVGIQSDGSVS